MGIERADGAGDATLAPLLAVAVAFLHDLALAHHVELASWKTLSIFRHPAASEDAVAHTKVVRRNLDEFVPGLFAWGNAHEDGSIAEGDRHLISRSGRHNHLAGIGFEVSNHSHHAQSGNGRVGARRLPHHK